MMVSKRFDKALQHTLKWEGGVVNDPDDPGGATNSGISLRFLRSVGDIDKYDYDGDGDLDLTDIMSLTDEQIRGLYYLEFWFDELDGIRYDHVSIKLFDVFVNTGVRQGTRLMQRALNKCVPPGWDLLDEDGYFGSMTERQLSIWTSNEFYADKFIETLENVLVKFYYELANRRPASRKFLMGWLRRAYDKTK